MEDSKAIIYTYKLDGTGTGAVVDPSSPADDSGILWIHLNGRSPDAKKFLKDILRLDPMVAKALLAEETRPRMDEFEENALIILRGIHYNPGTEPEDLVSIRLWLSKNKIVTIGRRKSKSIAEIHEKIMHQRGPRKVGEFISMLIGSLHDGIEPALRELEETTDRLEEQSLDHPDPELRNDIATIRKQAILFRRHMTPQRDVVYRLQHSKQDWMTEGDKWYMQDNFDRVSRHLEDLDAIRERTQIVQDELHSALASKLNQNIYVLSMITVIFMPLTFLTGLFGINVEGIPGAHSPAAFIVFCFLLAGVTVMEILLFRKLKWL